MGAASHGRTNIMTTWRVSASSWSGPGPPDHDPFVQVYPEWIAITYVFAVIGAMSLSATTRSGGLVTPNLSLTWIKAHMNRSETAPADAKFRVGQVTIKRLCLSVKEAIALSPYPGPEQRRLRSLGRATHRDTHPRPRPFPLGMRFSRFPPRGSVQWPGDPAWAELQCRAGGSCSTITTGSGCIVSFDARECLKEVGPEIGVPEWSIASQGNIYLAVETFLVYVFSVNALQSAPLFEE